MNEILITEGENFIIEVGTQGPPGSGGVGTLVASNIQFTPFGELTTTNIQSALEQLATYDINPNNLNLNGGYF